MLPNRKENTHREQQKERVRETESERGRVRVPNAMLEKFNLP